MDLFLVLISRCAALFRKQERDEDFDAELRWDIGLAIGENLQRGERAVCSELVSSRIVLPAFTMETSILGAGSLHHTGGARYLISCFDRCFMFPSRKFRGKVF